MEKTDKEVLELCKAWFEDIMERSGRLTSGNVSHGSRAIHGVAKNYAEFVAEHLERMWKPSERELGAMLTAIADEKQKGSDVAKELLKIYQQLKKTKGGIKL